MARPLVLVHGGAGLFDGERVELCIAGCERAAAHGLASIDQGALEAVVRAVKVMEEDPNFNAGLGATLTRDGSVELDAAVMTGDLRFGAVGACPPVSSAVDLARAVMRDGEHLMLVGEGAAEFAVRNSIPLVGPDDLIVERVKAAWQAETDRSGPDAQAPYRAGTVGAVALDASGALAAATSTGGILYKRRGRIGDTPIPGAGTYADADRRTAASATGEGEAIMRVLLCRQIADNVSSGMAIDQAVEGAMALLEAKTSGKAGVIAVSSDGSWHQSRNTRYMPWAVALGDGSLGSGA